MRDKKPDRPRPLISVIIPVYNVELYLDRCLASLLRQSEKRFEAICVDDASKDASASIAEEWAARDSRIKIIRLPANGGLSAARNAGMKAAAGEYLYFLDSDDWLDPDYLAAMLKAALLSEADIVLNTSFLRHDLDWGIYEHMPEKNLNYADGEFVSSHDAALNVIWCACAHLWKRDFIERGALLFPEGLSMEDQYFQALAYACVKRIYVIHKSAYHYYMRTDSICFKASLDKPWIPNFEISRALFNQLSKRDLLRNHPLRLFTFYIFPPPLETDKKLEEFLDFVYGIEPHVRRAAALYESWELEKFYFWHKRAVAQKFLRLRDK